MQDFGYHAILLAGVYKDGVTYMDPNYGRVQIRISWPLFVAMAGCPQAQTENFFGYTTCQKHRFARFLKKT